MNQLKKLALAITVGLTAASNSFAGMTYAPLPSNAYISKNGLDWAWAFPLPWFYGIDLSYQSQFGWHIPLASEMVNAPDAVDFLFTGANVPLGGSDPVSGAIFVATTSSLNNDGACATPYFSNVYRNCDWINGQPTMDWWGNSNSVDFSDQLVVRTSITPVPEPATASLLIGGMIILSAYRRKQVKE